MAATSRAVSREQFIMTNRPGLNVAAAFAVLAVWAGVYWFLHPHPPTGDAAPHQALGAVLAREALQRCKPEARLVVIARDAQPFAVPACEAQLDGFLAELKKSGRTVGLFLRIKLDPLRPPAVPPGDFFDLIRRGKDDDVIVSFLGPPTLDETQIAKLGARRPTILAVCPGTLPQRLDLRQLFSRKLLTAAVISRLEANPRPGASRGQAAFDQCFKLITAENVAELPTPNT